MHSKISSGRAAKEASLKQCWPRFIITHSKDSPDVKLCISQRLGETVNRSTFLGLSMFLRCSSDIASLKKHMSGVMAGKYNTRTAASAIRVQPKLKPARDQQAPKETSVANYGKKLLSCRKQQVSHAITLIDADNFQARDHLCDHSSALNYFSSPQVQVLINIRSLGKSIETTIHYIH